MLRINYQGMLFREMIFKFCFRIIVIMWQCPHCHFHECDVLANRGVVICGACSRESPLTSTLESVTVTVIDNSSPIERDGSRYKISKQLRGAAKNSKKNKKGGEGQEDIGDESFTTGQYIENRNTRSQHVRRHKEKLLENARRLSVECGWSVSVVAYPPVTTLKSADPLEISLADKNGRKPPPSKSSKPISEPPLLIERGTQFYSAVTGNHESVLTPSKDRERAVRGLFEDESYVSPISNSVLDISVADLQNTLATMPQPVIDTIPPTDSAVTRSTQSFCPPFVVTNSDTVSLPPESPQNQRFADVVTLTPTKSPLTGTTTGLVNTQCLETLVVPDRITMGINRTSSLNPGLVFARKSQPPGKVTRF